MRLLGRAAFHHVADVNVGAGQRDALALGRVLDHLRQQLAGTAHEGDALGVFIGAGAFTHEDQRRGWIAHAEDNLIAALVETAAAAISDIGEDLGEGLGGRSNRFRRRRRAPIQRLDAEVLVELEVAANEISVHGRHGGPGAVSGLRRKCGRRSRAWGRGAGK